MTYRELSPPAALAPYVDRFWTSTAIGPRIILPDGCIDILVDVARPEAPFVVGTMTHAARFPATRPIEIVAVRFRPGGAAPFLRVDADELTDLRVEDAVPWLRIDPAAPLPSLAAALLVRLGAVDDPDPLIAHAVARLAASDAPTIAELARTTGVTRQHLARRFQAHVGISPKQLGRVARMQRAMDVPQRSPRLELASTAAQLGYFDQAHMTNDFRELAALTPLAVRAAADSISPIRSLYRAP